MRVAYQTRIGAKRHVNQDTVLVDRESGLFIVADGMGGHNAGEIASALAVEEISKTIHKNLGSENDVTGLLERSVLKAHEVIFQNSLKNEDHEDMGTTVVVALARNDQAWFCNVGDSRAYLVGNNRIQQLTKDHTFVADMVKQGRVSREQARTHPARHGLTMALGVDDIVEPAIGEVSWRNGQCLLLCSDGLTDMLDDWAILEIVRTSADLDEACMDLVDKAQEKGGDDDITAVLICR